MLIVQFSNEKLILLQDYLRGYNINKKMFNDLVDWIKGFSKENLSQEEKEELENLKKMFWDEFNWDEEIVLELISGKNFEINEFKASIKEYRKKLQLEIKNTQENLINLFKLKNIRIDIEEIKLQELSNAPLQELKAILEIFIKSGDLDSFIEEEMLTKLTVEEKKEYQQLNSYEKKQYIKNKNILISSVSMFDYINQRLYTTNVENTNIEPDKDRIKFNNKKISYEKTEKGKVDSIYKSNNGIIYFIDTTADSFAMMDYKSGFIRDTNLPITNHYLKIKDLTNQMKLSNEKWEFYFIPSVNTINNKKLKELYALKKEINSSPHIKNFILSISKFFHIVKADTNLKLMEELNNNIKTVSIFYDDADFILLKDNPKIELEEIYELLKLTVNNILKKEEMNINKQIVKNIYLKLLQHERELTVENFIKDIIYLIKGNEIVEIFVLKFINIFSYHSKELKINIRELKKILLTIYPKYHPLFNSDLLEETINLKINNEEQEIKLENIKKKISNKDKEILNKDKEILNKDKEILNKDKEILNKNKEISNKNQELLNKDKELEQYKKIMSNYEKYKKIWLGLYTYFNRTSSSNRIGDEKYIEILNKYGTIIIVDTPKGKIKEVEEFKILELKPDEFFNDMTKLYIKVFKGFLNSEKFKERISLMIEIKKDLLLNYSTIIEGLELENKIEKENIINLIIKNMELQNEEINDILEDILNISNEEIKEKFLNELNNNPILIDMIKNGIKEENIELLKKEISKLKKNNNIPFKNKLLI